MGLLLTSLSVDYQRNSWSILEALRELIANAIDAEQEFKHEHKGQMKLHYDIKKMVFTITTKGVTVNPKALLMGTSANRSNDLCIGQFGEGLPMALLVLAREGWKITIYNGKEKWTPKIIKSEEYEGAKILAIETRTMVKPREDFIIEVEDIEPTEIEAVYRLFLTLDNNLSAVSRYESKFHSNEILTHPDYKGRIYIKGVFVTYYNNMLFGYNFNDIALNRDRKFVDANAINSSVLNTLLSLINESDEFLHMFAPIAFSFTNDTAPAEIINYSSDLQYNTKFSEALRLCWMQPEYAECVLCRSQEEFDSIVALNYKAIMVNNTVYDILSAKYKGTTFKDIKKGQDVSVLDVVALDNNISVHVNIAKLHACAIQIYPAITQSLRFVTFSGRYEKSSLDAEYINISFNSMNSFQYALDAYVRAILQHESLKGTHYSEQVYKQILEKLLEA